MAIDRVIKRSQALAPSEVQRGSSTWWTQNPMSYDWAGEVKVVRYSPQWFDAIDAKFLHYKEY